MPTIKINKASEPVIAAAPFENKGKEIYKTVISNTLKDTVSSQRISRI